MSELQRGFVSRSQAAAIIGIAPATLKKWSTQKKGPMRHAKLGDKQQSRTLYRIEEIESWIADPQAYEQNRRSSDRVVLSQICFPDRPAPPITEREKQALSLVVRFIETKKYAPSIRELAEGLGVSRSRAFQFLEALRKKGFIAREEKNRARTIRVLKGGDA